MMLTGSLLLTRSIQTRMEPLLLDPKDPLFVDHAERMIALFRDLGTRPVPVRRREIREELEPLLLGPGNQKVWEGISSILEKRCQFLGETTRSHEDFRLDVFAIAAEARRLGSFNRNQIMEQAALNAGLSVTLAEEHLFGDLPLEQTIAGFEGISGERLVHLYNIGLVQGILMQSLSLQVEADHPTPSQLRALANRMRFHRLIGRFRTSPEGRLRLAVDGPMSLFGPTHRYGFQLACFFPALLELKNFELRAKLAWGKRKTAKTLALSSEHGLEWPESRPSQKNPIAEDLLRMFSSLKDPLWSLSNCMECFPRGTTYWIPDLVLSRIVDGRSVFIEIPGYWKNRELETHLASAEKKGAKATILCLRESLRLGESIDISSHPGVYLYRKTPLISEILKRAKTLLD